MHDLDLDVLCLSVLYLMDNCSVTSSVLAVLFFLWIFILRGPRRLYFLCLRRSDRARNVDAILFTQMILTRGIARLVLQWLPGPWSSYTSPDKSHI